MFLFWEEKMSDCSVWWREYWVEGVVGCCGLRGKDRDCLVCWRRRGT